MDEPAESRPSSRMLVAVFGFVGLLCLGTGILKLASAWSASGWPTTDGVILESRLEERVDAESSSLVPHLRYQYIVEGTRYQSSRISFGPRSLTNDVWSRELVEKHPEGSRVAVHYDPNGPWQSALFVGVTAVGLAQPVVGMVFLASAVVIFVRARAGGGRRPA